MAANKQARQLAAAKTYNTQAAEEARLAREQRRQSLAKRQQAKEEQREALELDWATSRAARAADRMADAAAAKDIDNKECMLVSFFATTAFIHRSFCLNLVPVLSLVFLGHTD